MSTIEEPTLARPWRPEDGPPPKVWTWPKNDRPSLWVWSAGKWRHAPVVARQDWADGTVRYQVECDLRGDTTVVFRTYAWPQPGLRAGLPSGSEPSMDVVEGRAGEMPRRV
ncbi:MULTISPECIES: hypothetical protein [Streptomyces]|uniref:Transposase n=1 Tax=Streptomyces galilaeus TaxID=33899 RepID=A0ABW9IPP7_STRGJ